MYFFKNFDQISFNIYFDRSAKYIFISFLFCILSNFFNALAWKNIVVWFGTPQTKISLISFYVLTNVLKYVPGGIWHFLERYNFLKNISNPQFKKFVEKAWNKKDLVREISGPISVKTVYLVSAKKDDIRDEMLIVFSDISKSKNFEKMREDFIGNVSHELRTPISVIKANAETLIENKLIKDDENAKLFTQAIFSQSERMTVIVNDLLKISSMEAGEYPISIESINSFSIAKNLIEEFKPNLDKKKLTVQNNLNENTKVMADEAALKLILTNFLSNAIKHSPKKALIILAESSSSKGFIRLSVSDEGKGVPKKYKERVFERFYRIDKGRSSETGGTGLGLSISKNLALMMGYSVGVEANEPKGATFFIDIKVDEEKSIQAA